MKGRYATMRGKRIDCNAEIHSSKDVLKAVGLFIYHGIPILGGIVALSIGIFLNPFTLCACGEQYNSLPALISDEPAIIILIIIILTILYIIYYAITQLILAGARFCVSLFR